MQKLEQIKRYFDTKEFRLHKQVPADNDKLIYIVINQQFIDSLLQDKQEQLNELTTLQKYLSKNTIAQADLKSKKQFKLYTYDEGDAFKAAQIILSTDPTSDGEQLAKLAHGKNRIQADQFHTEQNAITVILPTQYSSEDLNQFIYGFRLNNYKFTLQTTEVGAKIANYSICYVNIISTIETEQFAQYLQSSVKQQIINQLPQSIIRVRDLVSSRANVATTTYMKNHALEIAKELGPSVKVTVIEGDELLEQSLRLIHAVGRTAKCPPALVCLEYNGNPESQDYLAFIGKGVIYDAGGLSIKSNSGMAEMYSDKTGACTVLEAFRALVKLGFKLNLVCTVALVENSIGTDAYRVSDIIQSYNGLTVEILNTDAEGRLILADAMSYTQHKFKVKHMIELSTLTGAVGSAIGRLCGLFTNQDQLVEYMKKVCGHSGERFWHLPLNDDHRQLIKGSISDIVNSTGGKVGASTAAAFLEQFVEKNVNWMHWDIASVALQGDQPTGFGVSSLVYFAYLQSIEQ